MDRVLIKTLFVSILLIVVAAYLHPRFKQADVPPLAEWHMINANRGGLQGDANLLLVGDQVIMIDAGLRDAGLNVVVPYLVKSGVERINHFFITAADPGYYEGLGEIIKAGIAVDRVYYRSINSRSRLAPNLVQHFAAYLKYFRSVGIKTIKIRQGFNLDLPNQSSLKVVAEGRPVPEPDPTLPGDLSLLIRFELPGSSVLFSGDIGTAMSNRFSWASGLSADFLKMPHPGRKDPVSRRFLNKINPKFVLVPSAKRYWCGDTGEPARSWSMDKEVPIWVTGTNGSVRVIWQSRQVMILPKRQDKRCKLTEYGNRIVNR